jgi:hypothetical protein
MSSAVLVHTNGFGSWFQDHSSDQAVWGWTVTARSVGLPQTRRSKDRQVLGTHSAALAGRDQMLGAGPLSTTAARTFPRLCGRVPALRRRAFTGFDGPARPLAWETAEERIA